MFKILVRPCRQDDLPGILALVGELGEVAHRNGQAAKPLYVRPVLAEMEKLPQIYFNLVAELSGQIVGYISVIFYRSVFHQGGTALINELIVTRDERRKGIGKTLLQKAKEEALYRGMDELEVGTERTNANALKFYHRYGFDQEYVLLGMEFE